MGILITLQVMPPDVQELLAELLTRQQGVLGADLLGVYLRGSLVSWDFDPLTSDVDLLCVVRETLTDAQFKALKGMHARVGNFPTRYARDVELTYLPRASARAWRPGEQHATLGRGEELEFKEHGANWLLERWVVLNQGLALYGPPPSALIDPVSSEDVRWGVRERLRDWAQFARTPDDPAWCSPLGHTAYCIETMCRALHTLERGEMVSKPAALAWAVNTLPQPWRALVRNVPAWRIDPAFNAEANSQAQAFILWTAAQAQKE